MKYHLICLFFILGFRGEAAAGFSKQDTSTVNRFNKIAASLFRSDPDSTLYYAEKSIALAEKIGYPTGLADGLVQAGHVNYFKGKSAEAVRNFEAAIVIYKQWNDQKGLGACYVQYGRMYNLLAEYEKALDYSNKALAIIKTTKDEYALSDCYKNIGIVYYSHGQLSKALDFYYEALFIAVKNHYSSLTADLYNNIGVILQSMEVYPNALEYYKRAIAIFEGTNDLQALGTLNENVGEVLLAQDKYDQAIAYLNKANSIAKKQNDQDGLSSVYTDLGLCYADKNQYGKAINYLDTSLRIGIKYKIVYNQAYALIGYATVYNMQKKYLQAYDYAVKGQLLAVKLGNLSVKATAALELNKTLAGLGRVDEAYKLLNEYIALKNSLKDNESIQKLTSYNFELSFAVKQRLLAQQQHDKDLLYKQNTRAHRLTNLIFIIVILAMIITTGIYYNQKRKQQTINTMLERKNKEVLNQKADLDEQTIKLNSLNTLKDRLIAILAHDLRAPLSTLRGLFDLLQDDSITHQEMLDMIPDVLKKLEYTSDFLDTLLFWINSQMETFDKAVKSFSVRQVLVSETESYVEQASKKGISLIENVPETLTAFADPSSIQIVVRNLITNAIKFSGKDDIIEISAKQENENILIKIRDTGVGMTAEQSRKLFKSKVDSKTGTHNELGTGMGLLFCKDLVERCSGKIWVQSEQGVGSEFSFTIPINTPS